MSQAGVEAELASFAATRVRVTGVAAMCSDRRRLRRTAHGIPERLVLVEEPLDRRWRQAVEEVVVFADGLILRARRRF